MKTYSEDQGKPSFDWNKFLNKRKINDVDWDIAQGRAKSWVTCACGNQCDIIPRNSKGIPEDEVLAKLGADDGFYGAIKGRNITEAKNFLILIEIRSSQLIKEIKTKK